MIHATRPSSLRLPRPSRVAPAWRIGVGQAGVIQVDRTGEGAQRRPQTVGVAKGAEHGMAVQTHDAAVAIDEWMDPAQALMSGGQGEKRRFTPGDGAVELPPALKQGRQAPVRGGDVTPHLHLALAQFAWDDGLALASHQVFRWQAGEQFPVNVTDRCGSVELPGTRFPAVALFDSRFGVDMGDSQTLSRGEFLVGGEVAGQRLLDFQRPGVLPLDAVGVVGIHPAQQLAQLTGHRQAGQLGCGACQIALASSGSCFADAGSNGSN